MSNLKYKHTAYTSAQWASLNPVIVENEIVIESDTKRTKIGNGISTYNELEYADANSVGNSLGSIKPTDAAPTPARNGNYTFSIGGNKPAWLTAEAGITEVKAGDGVAVVYTEPSSYSYTHVDIGSSIEQVRSQSTGNVPSSKLLDDELKKKFNVSDIDSKTVTIYTHPRGSSEYLGDASISYRGIAFRQLIDTATTFNKITLKACAASATTVYIRVYTADSLPSTFTPSSQCTFVEEISQSWDTVLGDRTINLADKLTIDAGKYLFVALSSKSITNITIGKWSADTYSDRNKVTYCNTSGSTIYDTAWTTLDYHWTTPLKLDLILPIVLTSDLVPYAKTEDINSASIDKLDIKDAISLGKNMYTDPHGDAEYIGDSSYGYAAVGYKVKMTSNIIFNQITLKAKTDSILVPTYFRIYKSSSVTYGDLPDTNWTFLEQVVTTLTTSLVDTVISLSTSYKILANEFVVVLMSTKSATKTTLGRWTSDPNNDRNTLLFCTSTNYSTIFNESWSISGYFNTPIKLDLVLPYAKFNEVAEIAKPRIILPSKIWAVVGTELNLYYDAIVQGSDAGLNSPKEFIIEAISTVGKVKERCFSITPVSGDIGTKALILNVYNSNHTLLATKTVSLIIIAATAPSSVKNIVELGDSLLASNTITQITQAKFAEIGSNTPLFRGFSGISPANHQGIGGWYFSSFSSVGPSYYKFTVSGVSTVASSAIYSNNGSQFTVREVNITGGVGYIKCQRTSGTNEPTASGSLVKVSGTGDATINYSANVLEAGNPLWNPSTSALDIAYYRANLGMGATKLDIVTMQLGVNDAFNASLISDSTITTTIIDAAKSICAAFLSDNALTKIIIQLPTTDGNTKSGWGANYGTAYSKAIYQSNLWRIRELIITNFDNAAYSANIEVGYAGLAIDRYYGYELQDAAISARLATTEKVHVNALHPTSSGYQQIGDAYFPHILKLIQ